MSLKSLLKFALVLTPLAAAAQQTQQPASSVPVPLKSGTDTVDRIVAVVGDSVITWSDLATAVNQQRAAGLQLPPDSAGQLAIARQILSGLVDEEILLQKAPDMKVDVSESDVSTQVDRRLREIRSHFQSDAEYRAELKNAGFGTPEEYRRSLADQVRRSLIQQQTFAALQKTAKPASVSEDEVTAAFDKVKGQLQQRPAYITFRQIVVAPVASKAADSAALAKAESLLVELHKGADFEEMAKRESMDPGTKNLGGDLGWNRRGSGLVPQFEAVMFALRPGQLSPIVKTSFGYHIIRVDRVQPAEVKARHILIAPVIDSNDVHIALLRADTVAQLWRKGANFDSLVAKYHDPAEEKAVLTPWVVDSLPPSYRTAIEGLGPDQVSAPFPLQSANGTTKYAVIQVITRTAPGEYSLAEERNLIRGELASEKQARELLDDLRKHTYVSLRL